MAYTKRNFQKEQLLTAEDLNAMDVQIAKNEESANEAKTAATNAASAASESKAVAVSAQNIASEAITAAAEAKATATNAASAAEEANTAAAEAKDIANDVKSDMENALLSRETLTSANDLNDIVKPGMYNWYNTDVPVNSPAEIDSIMIVYQSGNIVVQNVIPWNRTYGDRQRIKYYNTWTEWIATSGTGAGDNNNALNFKRTLTAEDDLNNIRQTGIYDYYLDSVPQNTPFGENASAVLIYIISGYDENCTLQVAVKSNKMMYRSNNTVNNTQWGEWESTKTDIEILQSYGDREDAVMSQLAVTTFVNNKTANVESAYNNSAEAVRIAAESSNIANSAKDAVGTAIVARRELTEEDNIDDITEPGIYTWLNGSPPSGRPPEPETGDPTPRSAMLFVYNFKDQYVQIVIEQVTARTMTRAKMSYEETWCDWVYPSEVVQTVGGSKYFTMSQNAITGQIERLDARIDGITSSDEGDSGADYSNVIQTMAKCFTNGVFVADDPDALKPTPGDGLKLITNPGTVLIEGYSKKMAKNTRTFLVKEQEYHEVYLLRLYTDTGEIERITREVILYGDLLLSLEDAAELPVRSGGWYDILLSKITIPAGATQITEDMIEDYRDNDNYCGHVRNKL